MQLNYMDMTFKVMERALLFDAFRKCNFKNIERTLSSKVYFKIVNMIHLQLAVYYFDLQFFSGRADDAPYNLEQLNN